MSRAHILLLVLVTGAGFLLHSLGAAAQPAKVKPASGDDLRAAYASVLEIAEGRRVAEASCASCHGLKGISTTKGVPHLAAQRPVYLHLELRAYQAGARDDKPMTASVKFLSDDALVKVFAYYASLEPAQPGAAKAAKASARPDPVAAGKAACHGDAGVSGNPANPSLAGQDAHYLAVAIRAYTDGSRKDDAMKGAVAALDDRVTRDLAAFYATQQPRPTKVRKPLTTPSWRRAATAVTASTATAPIPACRRSRHSA